MDKYFHIPVLKKEAIEFLKPERGGIFVDGTLGGGGHARALARECKMKNEKFKIIGIDLDSEALKAAQKKLAQFKGQVIFINDNFANIKNILARLKIKKASGILLDLGVSSYQLEAEERGFSFGQDAELDMRMDQNQILTAKEIVNHWPEMNLREIFQKLAESPFAGRIAHKIILERAQNPIETTDQLVEIIKSATPPKWRFSRQKHFATNIFRALRMTANTELENLEQAIPEMISSLEKGGRLVIISFHSLEDRIAKNQFKKAANPCVCPLEQPQCVCGQKPQIKILTKKPIQPSQKEIFKNPKARSAKLRAAEKL